jgi:hypothetical protein
VEIPGLYFGAIQNFVAGPGIDLAGSDVPHPGGPNYVTQFAYCAAPDACGTFGIDFILPPADAPFSVYQTPDGTDWPATWQPLQVIVDNCASPLASGPGDAPGLLQTGTIGVHEGVMNESALGGTIRTFMVEMGTDPSAAPITGPTSVQMAAGTIVEIAAYFENSGVESSGLNSYQIILPWFANGGDSGTVSYVDIDPGMLGGNSLEIDRTNPDWVFTNAQLSQSLPVSYNETPATIFGVLFAIIPGKLVDILEPGCNLPNCGGPNYLLQFSIVASPDASGVFHLPFNTSPAPPPLSAYFTWCGAGIGPVTYQGLDITVVPCSTHTQCADTNMDGLRNDSCTWWQCDAGACAGTAVPFADIGGAIGACPPDGVVDGNDHFHALNCFSNINTMGMSSYPCEDSPPLATNADAGGPFGQCCPDGVCDGNDAFHTRHGFAGDSPCECPANFVCPCPVPTSGNCVGNKLQLCTSDDDCGGGTCNLALCPPGPQPDAPPNGEWPRVAGRSAVRLVADRSTSAPGDLIDVDVFLEDALSDLRGYQLHVEAAGGKRGTLELVDVAIHERRDHVFAGLADWRAFNARTGQMLAGLDEPGIETSPGAYLATFTFKASADAAGTFSVELLHDDRDPAQRTFIFPTHAGAKIEVEFANAALVTVKASQARASRRM